MPSCGAFFVLADFCFCSAGAYPSLSPAVSCFSISSISGALRPPGMVAPNAGTNRNLRTKKISAMDATLIKFSTADSCPTIIWRAMAYSSTSSALPGLCLASILMNSMPMTISSARCKNRLISTSLVSTSRPGSILISGTTASINATTTSSEMPTSSRPANSASWSRKMRFTRSSPLCSTVREKWGCLLFVSMFLLPWGVS